MTPPLRQLGWVIARDVNRTVGGGMASMELLRRSFDVRGWVDAAGHGVLVAVSRLTPGTNILAYCAAVGWRLHRLRGAMTAVVAASLPAAALIFVLSATLVRLDRYPVVQFVLSMGTLAAAGLVFASAWALLKPYVRSAIWPRALVIIVLAAALYLSGWTPVRVLLTCAIAGALLPPVRTGGPKGPPLRTSGNDERTAGRSTAVSSTAGRSGGPSGPPARSDERATSRSTAVRGAAGRGGGPSGPPDTTSGPPGPNDKTRAGVRSGGPSGPPETTT